MREIFENGTIFYNYKEYRAYIKINSRHSFLLNIIFEKWNINLYFKENSIRDFNKIGGLEELLNCLEGVQYLDEKKLKWYLDLYNTQVLYQRAGYLLEHYRQAMQLSNAFIEYCKEKVGNSLRYLVGETKGRSTYNSEWKLMEPEGLYEVTEQL